MPEFENPEQFFQFVQQQNEQAHSHMHAMREDIENRINELLISMSPEHLALFRSMCIAMAVKPNNAAHYGGMAQSILTFVHKVCIDCGIDHSEEEIGQLMAESGSKTELDNDNLTFEDPPAEQIIDTETYENSDKQTTYKLNWRKQEGTHELFFTQKERKNMAEYNLDDAYSSDSRHSFLGFVCKNCGTLYVSIEDRMIKAPDDCHGCFLKSAFG